MQYCLKPKTIIIVSLGEFSHVSHSNTTKEIWNILQVTHEDTTKIKKRLGWTY